jgi:hypothetical protein
VIVTLDVVGREREPLSRIDARGADHDERVYGIWSRVNSVFVRHGISSYNRFFVSDAIKRCECIRLLLQTRFALDLFEQDRGRRPDRLDELVPDYLSQLPVDPYNDQTLKFVSSAGAYKLYSVGRDGKDNGGKIVGWEAGQDNTSGVDVGFDIGEGELK